MKCAFCNVPATRPLLHKCELYLAFESKRKVAETHIILLPRLHVPHKLDLLQQNSKMLSELTQIGRGLCDSNASFYIHAPPFNSINHFHIHCFAGKFNNIYQRLVHEWFAIKVDG